MTKETELLLKEYKNEYKNYKGFIDTNDWFDDVYANTRTGKLESSKLSTEVSIIDTIIKGTSKFKEDIGLDIDTKPVHEFIKFTADMIVQHIKRIQEYKKLYPIDAESTESDVGFHSDLFALITKTKVALSKLQIDENDQTKKSVDLFYGNTKAPLVMRSFLSETFPIIKEKTEKLGIDFYAPSINPLTSNELYINMKPKDIPKWDTRKHFFEQDLSTIQFWEEELRKIKNGITVYDYSLSPWLYWHLNHFKLSYIDDIEGKVTKQPLLRDNEYYFDEMYKKAENHGRCGLFLYGTRRFGKSVVMSSKSLHGLYTINKCQATIQGFSAEPDLKAIIDYIGDAVENMEPALRIPANSMDLKDGAVLGLKGKKAQDRYDLAKLAVINLEAGTSKKGTQKTAGATPDVFVFDEAAKGECIAPWTAAIPSFAGGKKGKWRLVPMLSATAGVAELSENAESMLKDPETYNIMPMDYDILESIVDPEYITWTRTQFGMFVPAQISIEGAPKLVKTFSEFLKLDDNPVLDEINIEVTDWENQNKFFNEKREEKSKDIKMLASYTNSFPLEVEDCYLTTEINMFPGLECKARKSYIEREGLDGQKYRLFKQQGGEIHAEMVTDPTIDIFPYKGGNFDAPVVMLENPLLFDTPPPLGLYILGLDDAKDDTAGTPSVLSATFFKRGYEGGEWANRIVGWYDSRPEKKKDYYKQLYYMMKIYNARVLYENADNGFIEYVETNYPEDVHVHFSTGVGLASEENLHRNTNKKFGWTPTGQNIYLLNQKVVMYTKEDGIVIGDQSGLSGVERINHPMLLEELYKFKKDLNADRLRSFGLALTLARYYDNTYQYMKTRRKRDFDENTYQKKSTRSSYGGIVYDSRIK